MTKQDKILHYREVNQRLEFLLKEYYIISNLDNPFAKDVKLSENDIKEVLVLYRKFDGVRNSVKNEDTIQSHFENFIEINEELVKKIKETTESLAMSGEEYAKLEESRAIDFAKIIRTQVVKFKNWINSSIEKLSKLKEIIKEDMSMIEKEIQKQLNF